METETGGLSVAELADLAGVTEAEIDRLVDLGILVARDGTRPFLATDAQKVRLAMACEQAGLPMEGIALAIRAGRLSFALDRKSTRLNSSHVAISYAVFCLK